MFRTYRLQRQIFLYILCVLLVACTPYDTNERNKELLQGSWLLVEVPMENGGTKMDTYKLDLSKDTTLIRIEGNRFMEDMPDIRLYSNYTFSITNYIISLYRGDTLQSKSTIEILAGDSLLLKQGNLRWKYRRIPHKK